MLINIKTGLKLFILYLFLWIILSGARVEPFPLVFILILSLITPYIFTLSYRRVSILGVLRLSFWFLLYSIKGGMQVALFALKPKLNLSPFIHTHRLKNHTSFTLSLLANIYSLMPGTLTIEEREGVLKLHILDERLFEPLLIDRFEEYVLAAFMREDSL